MTATFKRVLNTVIVLTLPLIIRRALRRGLGGVYLRGALEALPARGVLLAANHHAWWDPYLAWWLGRYLERPLSGLMLSESVARFPFFRAHGALKTTEVREALRRLRRGELLIIFPEGRLSPAGEVREVSPGLEFLAARAGAPIFPLMMRVVLRGAQYPEAYLWLGGATDAGQVRGVLNTMLRDFERELDAADPEAPLPGWTEGFRGRASTHTKASRFSRFFRGDSA